MFRKIIIAVIGPLLSLPVQSQGLSEKEIKEVAFEIAELIRSNYVLEDKGNEIAGNFIDDVDAGRFDFADSWDELDSAITASLKEASEDGHLYTRNDPALVKQLKLESENESEEEKTEINSFYNNEEAFNTNFGFQKLEIIQDNIGYIRLSKINISKESLKTLYAAMEFVRNTKALIIDLRDNGGGGSEVGAVLESFFLKGEPNCWSLQVEPGQRKLKKRFPG